MHIRASLLYCRYMAVVAIFALLSVDNAAGESALSSESVPNFAVPRMSQSPVIDGAIGATEWREAMAVSGVADPRPTDRLGRDSHSRDLGRYLTGSSFGDGCGPGMQPAE